jgi:uncharacterized protein
MALVQPHPQGTLLAVKVVPGSSRDRIAGRLGERLKVCVRKPPERGAANEAVCGLVAKALNLRARDVVVVKGDTRPEKELLIQGLGPEEVLREFGFFPGNVRNPAP